ncbi:MAG TPA: MFS transporter [Candidatus Krumholzibacteria bacterium]|nr:MFS transporter [Candidatus Krumholzibacteria bacterium]
MPRTVWVLFVGTLINRFGSFVFVFLAVYLTGKGYTAPQAGLAIGAYGVGAICASLVGGWLADHLGRRNTIVLSMLLSASVMVGLSQAAGYALLMTLTVLAGFCAEMYRPAASALIADVTTPAQRVTAYALYRLAINAGFAIGPAVGGFMASKSFFFLFLGDAVTSLLYAVIAIAALPNRVVEHHATHPRRSALRVVLNDSKFLLFLGSTMAASMVFMQHVSSYPLWITSLGFSSAVFGMLISLNGVLICLTELPLTSYTRRLPARRVMVIGMLVFGTGFAATGLGRSIPFLAATVIVWTIGEMFYFPMAAAHVANISPPDMRGRYHGAWGISWGLGAVVGPVLGTALFAVAPRAVWPVCGVVAVLGALLLLPATREHRAARAVTEAP